MDRLCLNAQCSLITTTTGPTPCFYYFFDDKIFVTVDKNAGIFTKHIWHFCFFVLFRFELMFCASPVILKLDSH